MQSGGPTVASVNSISTRRPLPNINQRWFSKSTTSSSDCLKSPKSSISTVKRNLLPKLLIRPTNEITHRLSITIPLSTMYGYTPTSLTDPVILAADESIELGTQVISPGGSLANVFPILKYVPWTWTQRMAKEIRRLTEEMKSIPLEALKKDMVSVQVHYESMISDYEFKANGTASPCLVGEFLEKKQVYGATEEEEETILNVANTVYGAASDTTISATESLFYLLTTHPDVQAKAQAELDNVLLEGGMPRLPTLEDRPSLPYIEAIYREVMRWGPPLPLGLPHATTEDDWYKGYFIPKGTIISPNIWAMTHDENRYPEPMAFKPERFLNDDGTLNQDDRILAYGFGRRVCVGKHVASSTLWLAIACVLACFNLEPKRDADGNVIDIDDKVHEEGLLAHKTPFKCNIEPRSVEWMSLVETLSPKNQDKYN
ncbi:hypothetical protein CVT24_010380 [Panaeolus cyanescens]|uniref:Cytochrome P450 n=1 Tax=Panaeolus cyanescens TaxID=181874 RepID=A0A409YQ41_9AGAR|nr:hypothetical protein CVT24_010380 [Panaeolus cyanescens]